jgi:hypothetical protein
MAVSAISIWIFLQRKMLPELKCPGANPTNLQRIYLVAYSVFIIKIMYIYPMQNAPAYYKAGVYVVVHKF